MACEDSGLTAGLKPVVRADAADHCCTEKQMGSLRGDRRPSRSQNIFLNFAGRSFGQLVNEGHTMWRFEVRELRPRKLAQLALIGSCAFMKNNKGVRRLAPFFMWEPDDRNLLDGGVSQEYTFNFNRRNIFAAA